MLPGRGARRGDFIRRVALARRLEHPPPGWTTFVAVDDDGAVLGFASVGPSRDERGLGELYAIYVAPGRVVDGRRAALLVRGELELRAVYDEATLWVLEDNPRARSFYEAAGWAPTEREGATSAGASARPRCATGRAGVMRVELARHEPR